MSTDIQMTTGQVRGPAIHVRALEKSYKDLHVLRGVDFDVARGSIFALLGSNGAGKTTVVKLLATMVRPETGTATVEGFDVRTQLASVRPVDQPHRAVRGGGRDSHRVRELGTDGPASARQRAARIADDCSSASSSPMRPPGGWRPTPEACAAGWTSP